MKLQKLTGPTAIKLNSTFFRGFLLGLFCLLSSTANLSAIITVTQFSGSDNLPAVVLGITLDNRSDLDPGYAAIFNTNHTDYSGSSNYEFARFAGGADCIYWFDADETPGIYVDSYASSHWLGFGDNTPVDGVNWGSDNFIHLVESGTTIAILQFNFDELSKTASLVAAATDLSGLTFANGVAAIQAAAVPEASTYATIAGLSAMGLVLLRRRKQS